MTRTGVDDPDAALAEVMEHLPANVQASLAQQLATLPPTALDLLRAAAVEGMVFSAEVVMRVTGCDPARWISEMDGLLVRERSLVDAVGTAGVQRGRGHRYTFWHGLLRQHLLEAMGQVRRRDLHRSTAEALIALYGPGGHDATVAIAEHFAEAKEHLRAATAWIHAGDHALVQGAHRDARDRFSQVSRHISASEDVAIFAHGLMGLAAAARGLEAPEEAHAWVDRALAMLERRDLPASVANAQIIKGLLAFDAGDMATGATHQSEAAAGFLDADKPLDAARALGSLGSNLHGLGRYRDALDAVERSLAIGREHGDDGIVLFGLLVRANCWLNLGFYAEATAGYEACRRVCADVGNAVYDNFCLVNIALGAIETGDWDAATAALDEIVQPGRRVSIRLMGGIEEHRGMIAEGTGAPPEVARGHFEKSLDIRRRCGQAHMVVDSLAWLLRVALREADLTSAAALLAETEALHDARGVGGVVFYSRLYLTLHDACRALDREDDARRYLAKGRALLCARADILTDPEHRHSYLTNVPANRQLLALAAERGVT